MGDPESANYSPAGIARYSTTRARLSQWSIDDSNARAEKNIRDVRVPLLAIENSADDAVPQSHTSRLLDAASSPDKQFVLIEGADHYYADQPDKLEQMVAATVNWLVDRRLFV